MTAEQVIMCIFLGPVLFASLLCLVMLVRNRLVARFRKQLLDECYDRAMKAIAEGHDWLAEYAPYENLGSYEDTIWDFRCWTYEQFRNRVHLPTKPPLPHERRWEIAQTNLARMVMLWISATTLWSRDHHTAALLCHTAFLGCMFQTLRPGRRSDD